MSNGESREQQPHPPATPDTLPELQRELFRHFAVLRSTRVADQLIFEVGRHRGEMYYTITYEPDVDGQEDITEYRLGFAIDTGMGSAFCDVLLYPDVLYPQLGQETVSTSMTEIMVELAAQGQAPTTDQAWLQRVWMSAAGLRRGESAISDVLQALRGHATANHELLETYLWHDQFSDQSSVKASWQMVRRDQLGDMMPMMHGMWLDDANGAKYFYVWKDGKPETEVLTYSDPPGVSFSSKRTWESDRLRFLAALSNVYEQAWASRLQT